MIFPWTGWPTLRTRTSLSNATFNGVPRGIVSGMEETEFTGKPGLEDGGTGPKGRPLRVWHATLLGQQRNGRKSVQIRYRMGISPYSRPRDPASLGTKPGEEEVRKKNDTGNPPPKPNHPGLFPVGCEALGNCCTHRHILQSGET